MPEVVYSSRFFRITGHQTASLLFKPVLVFAMIAVAVPCHSLWGIRQPSQLKWTWRGVPANILIHETPMDQVRREDNSK